MTESPETLVPTGDPLTDALDKAAMALLSKIPRDGNVISTDQPPEGQADVVEQVKIFAAVVDWFKTRHGIVPKEPVKNGSDFSALRDQFNGKTPGRRGRKPSRAPVQNGGTPINLADTADDGDDAGDDTDVQSLM